MQKNYRDFRRVDRPADVVSTDKPAADTNRYLELGNNIMTADLTKGKWQPGQLIGKDGSDPAIISQSLSFAPAGHQNELTERRSATSTGHILLHRRPAGVPLGWGGYDEYTTWQSFGRRIDKDTVKKGEWSSAPVAPVTVVDEAGQVAKIFTPPFKKEHVLPQAQEPVSLHDLLHKSKDTQKPKDSAEHRPVKSK